MYYGLDLVEPGSGFDIMFGADMRYHIYKNFYVFGQATLNFLDADTRETEVIDDGLQSTFYLGIGFFNDKKKSSKVKLKSKPYVRVAHGWATPSNIGEIIRFNSEKDPYDNKLTSLFVGIPLADDLFDIPFSVYLTPGFVFHHKSDVQSRLSEYVLAIKAYYTFRWPIEWLRMCALCG